MRGLPILIAFEQSPLIKSCLRHHLRLLFLRHLLPLLVVAHPADKELLRERAGFRFARAFEQHDFSAFLTHQLVLFLHHGNAERYARCDWLSYWGSSQITSSVSGSDCTTSAVNGVRSAIAFAMPS